MKQDQELIVITKTYDLILWPCNYTSKFPRNHRFVLGERIERNPYGLLETLIRPQYTKNRQRLLEEANLSLEVLRFQMRLAKYRQCLEVESYAFVAKTIDEIGWLVGGWLRRSQDQNASSQLFSRHKETERPDCRITWNREPHWIDVEGTSGVAEVRRYSGRRWAGSDAY